MSIANAQRRKEGIFQTASSMNPVKLKTIIGTANIGKDLRSWVWPTTSAISSQTANVTDKMPDVLTVLRISMILSSVTV
jgi:hypothetical protein